MALIARDGERHLELGIRRAQGREQLRARLGIGRDGDGEIELARGVGEDRSRLFPGGAALQMKRVAGSRRRQIRALDGDQQYPW